MLVVAEELSKSSINTKTMKTDTVQDLENVVNETPLDKVQEMLEWEGRDTNELCKCK